MAGSRRLQRSRRVTNASLLLFLAASVVMAAVVTATWLSAAAVFAVVGGVLAVRLVHGELLRSRKRAAIDRATQARTFGADLATKQQEHTAFTRSVTTKLQDQQRTLMGLEGTVRLAEKRAEDAETRMRREARRADDAQERLSSLLDAVLMHSSRSVPETDAASAAEDELFDSSDLPTVIDLMAWEEHANASAVKDLRRRA
ncbi:MAG: hypothetical protein H0T14_01150 [Nocardioidaceae bacterium]|nr:hypothetical protein [Nocardioidaceae bacterium]